MLEHARDHGTRPGEAAAQVAAEEPALRPLVERLAPKMRAAFITFLLVVVELLLSQGISELRDDSATREDVRLAVEEALERVQSSPGRYAAPQGQAKPQAARPPTDRGPATGQRTPRAAESSTDSKKKAKRAKRPPKKYGVKKKKRRGR